MPVEIHTRFTVNDDALTHLHARAFGTTPNGRTPWNDRLRQHALTWVGAFDGEEIVGFVQVCWDGGSHAFLLDTVVDPARQRQGIGEHLVNRARQEAHNAGCQWIHVDFEPHLEDFYIRTCGFHPTAAGLISLRP